MPTRDHVRPVWGGGTFRIICCRKCNADKGQMFLSQWLTRLRKAGDPRARHVEAAAIRYAHLASPLSRAHPSDPVADDLRRTDAEIAFARMRGETGEGALPCVICAKVFLSDEARKQHFEAKHVTA